MLNCLYKRCCNFTQPANSFINSIRFFPRAISVITFICLLLVGIVIIFGCIYVITGMIPAVFILAVDPYVQNLMKNNTLPCPINIIYKDITCSVFSFGFEIFTWFIICVSILILISICIFCIFSIYRCNSVIKDKCASQQIQPQTLEQQES